MRITLRLLPESRHVPLSDEINFALIQTSYHLILWISVVVLPVVENLLTMLSDGQPVLTGALLIA